MVFSEKLLGRQLLAVDKVSEVVQQRCSTNLFALGGAIPRDFLPKTYEISKANAQPTY